MLNTAPWSQAIACLGPVRSVAGAIERDGGGFRGETEGILQSI